MRRIASSLLALAGAAALGGCDLEITGFDGGCLLGPCTSGPPPQAEFYVLGFPSDRVDRSTTHPDGGYRGRVAVGDTFTLHLVLGPPGRPPLADLDTVRVDRWEVTDSAAAAISPRPWGAGLFIAKAPGVVRVSQDQRFHPMWACQGQGCARVSEIVITR